MNWWTTFCLAVTTYLIVFFEASFQGIRNLTGAQIDLLPSLMVYVALARGPKAVVLFSLFGGLLFDSVSVNPLGISVISLLLIGFGICQSRELILKDQQFAQITLGIGASGLAPLFTLLLLLLLGHQPLVGWFSLWQWIIGMVVGGILTPVWFIILGRLHKALTHPSDSDSSAFRPDREIKRGKH